MFLNPRYAHILRVVLWVWAAHFLSEFIVYGCSLITKQIDFNYLLEGEEFLMKKIDDGTDALSLSHLCQPPFGQTIRHFMICFPPPIV